jgi:hypothetical protein
MFLLDSLMISGIRWALQTVVTAAEAEMNDDSALRDRLLEAEMQREMGEISDAEYGEIEADLLRAIREIKERRDGGSGAFAFGAQPLETSEDSRFQIEAEVSGDFYGAPATQPAPEVIAIIPDAVAEVVLAPVNRSARSSRSNRSTGTKRSTTAPRSAETARTVRPPRTARTNRAK